MEMTTKKAIPKKLGKKKKGGGIPGSAYVVVQPMGDYGGGGGGGWCGPHGIPVLGGQPLEKQKKKKTKKTW